MTPIDTLVELLERVGASGDGTIFINEKELSLWPSTAVKAMKSQKLIAKARPAGSAVCPGCERNCVMTVHTVSKPAGRTESFIVCDKRDDVNRVAVSVERLIRWQCTADLVSRFLASTLGLRQSVKRVDNEHRWEIGIVLGNKRSQTICLEASGTLALVAGSNKVPISEFVEFHDGRYSLDSSLIRRLVDTATTVDNRYTPSIVRRETRKLNTQEMYESWRKAYRDKKKGHPGMSDVWYSQQIAKMNIAHGRDAETIRKRMKD